MQYTDEQIMRRCFELACNGAGKVAPNPMVGAVIVHNGQVIGEGYHMRYGEPHAEVMAVNSVNDKLLLPQSTLYVSLEPCCHYGKTPPCSQLILDMGIPKVVVAATDPFPKVSGGGVKMLRDNGVEVVVGVLEGEARELNKFFYTFYEKKRPYIILKWAQSIDGYIDAERSITQAPAKITNGVSQALVHKWRAEVQSIMVGTNTVLKDNPQLTVRKWMGNNPMRIVVDCNSRLSSNLNVFDNNAQTLLFIADYTPNINYGDNVIPVKINFNNNIEEQILDELYKRQIQSVFIEGGTQLLNSFINKNLWDEARVFVGNVLLKNGVKAPEMPNNIFDCEDNIYNDRLLVFRQNNL